MELYLKTSRYFFTLYLCLFAHSLFSAQQTAVNLSADVVNQHTVQLTVDVALAPEDVLYKDFITFSVDTPQITLSPWHSSVEAVDQYDPISQTTKKVFKTDVTLNLTATYEKGAECQDAHLHMSYQNGAQQFVDNMFAIPCPVQLEAPVKMAEGTVEDGELATAVETNVTIKQQKMHCRPTWSTYLSTWVETTESLWLRLLLVFLLGILLSLTPCIYPMIPITVGILHTHKSRSVLANFLLSLTYTLGVATTFAALGLLAAVTGQMVGQILTNPFVILAFIAMLTYLALSMFGYYEMYVPRFLSNNKYTVKGGSYISVFLFGVASGCVASPCLSPGLVLLLTIVSTLGSNILGFLLLFAFGVGLSVPLLIIGTFSGSLSVLPSAGMWMVEVKKLFGLILLGMNFYFLNLVISKKYLLPLFGLFVLASGIYVLGGMVRRNERGLWTKIKKLIGILLVASSIAVFWSAYKAIYVKNEWQTDINAAQQQAVCAQKKLFLDMSAPYCGICRAIESSMLKDPVVAAELEHFVTVHLEDPNDAEYKVTQKKYDIKGVPALLVIDPGSETILARWGAELYDMDNAEFIEELQKARQ
jgi:thiol:disulfide interchange protein DsbD